MNQTTELKDGNEPDKPVRQHSANRRLLAPSKYDLVAKCARPMFQQTGYPRTYIFAFKQRRGHFVASLVRRADTVFQVSSDDLLAGRIRECGPVRQPLRERPGLRFKRFIGNDLVDDVPSLKRRRVVLVGGVYDLARAVRPRALSEALNPTQQRGGSNRRLRLTEAG